MKIVSSHEMRELDARATNDFGIPSLILMENAGVSVFLALEEMLGDVSGKKIVVLAGAGNNGGDGFVAARHLHNAGADVIIYRLVEPDMLKGDAQINSDICIQMQIPSTTELTPQVLESSDIIIDALLGTGIKGKVREEIAEVIEICNSSNNLVLSVDIPSGVDGDTGKICGNAIIADTTVTLALPKPGLLIYPGAQHCGNLIIADISLPVETLNDNASNLYMLDSSIAESMLPMRYADSNKGTYGKLAIVAGSVGLTGAVALAAESSLKIGTGLVTIALPESLNDILETKVTEAMTLPIPEISSRAFGLCSVANVLEAINSRSAAVIGPGIGRADETVKFILELIPQINRPSIIDADALFAISQDILVLRKSQAPLILTPHPGEMAGLLGISIEEVQSNRLIIARKFAEDYGVVLVLKGADTIIASPDGTAFINTSGCSALATGGTGDVLSGMIGGLLAQGLKPIDAAACGVFYHGYAGELAAEKLSDASVIASDIISFIGSALKTV